jgi:hypothetical protein
MVIESSRTRKQRKEYSWFEQARRVCSAFPQGPFEQPDPPDIFFRDRQLGIEIIEYIRGQGIKGGSPERRLESNREKIVAVAQAKFEQRSSGNIHVSVFWVNKTVPHGTRASLIADRLTELVSGMLRMSDVLDLCWRPNFNVITNRLDIEYFGQICVRRLRKSNSSWTCDNAGMIGNYAELLQKTIDIKKSKVPRYAESCGEVWLLIVATPHYISTTFSPDEDFDSATFRTHFHRVFVLDSFRDQVRELKITK